MESLEIMCVPYMMRCVYPLHIYLFFYETDALSTVLRRQVIYLAKENDKRTVKELLGLLGYKEEKVCGVSDCGTKTWHLFSKYILTMLSPQGKEVHVTACDM